MWTRRPTKAMLLGCSAVACVFAPLVIAYQHSTPHFVEQARRDASRLFEDEYEFEDVRSQLLSQGWTYMRLQDLEGERISSDWATSETGYFGYRFPCASDMPDWMKMSQPKLVCFEKVAPYLPYTSQEAAILCTDGRARSEARWVVAHLDAAWPVVTWEGTLIPEGNVEKYWYGYPVV